jgi:hypothetical protein
MQNDWDAHDNAESSNVSWVAKPVQDAPSNVSRYPPTKASQNELDGHDTGVEA